MKTLFLKKAAPLLLVVVASGTIITLVSTTSSGQGSVRAADLFSTADQCQACHNNLGFRDGQDLSIGTAWAGTMMAHSAVDPYWRAGVRREITDHPSASAAIQDECSKCHKPMQRYMNSELGRLGRVFPGRDREGDLGAAYSPLALDGVSCSLCHQIDPSNLGSDESLVGGFIIDGETPLEERKIHGPYHVAANTKRIMASASGFLPSEGAHVRSSELCATCHTLYTHSLDDQGNDLGRFPEQVPFLEWQHSDYADGKKEPISCQGCHMERASGANAISSVLGKPRPEFAMHSFKGGNFFMQQLIGHNSGKVTARTDDRGLALGATRTVDHLRTSSASVYVDLASAQIEGDRINIPVVLENLAGHKLPTAYPSRRAWIHLRVEDASGRMIFESGELTPDGAVAGNDNDQDAARFEPHYSEITDPGQVQIFESIMGRPDGEVTTGLLTATQYLKDNRVLPKGFAKAGAHADVAVHGAAAKDESFDSGRSTTVYSVPFVEPPSCFKVTATLYYQPVGYRWAMNLDDYDEPEPKLFVEMYSSASAASKAVILSEDIVEIRPAPTTPPAPESCEAE